MSNSHSAPDKFEDESWETYGRGSGYDVGGQDGGFHSISRNTEYRGACSRTYGRSPEPLTISQTQSNSMNPASTFQFIMHMGYPPPPVAFDSLRRHVEMLTDGPGDQLDDGCLDEIILQVDQSPYRIAPVILFVIQQRLHSSKMNRVRLALQLLAYLSEHCKLKLLRVINLEMMRSLGSVVRIASFKERTLSGQISKLGKFLSGNNATLGISTDMRVHGIRLEAKTLIRNWVDNFSLNRNELEPIYSYYEILKSKGVNFDDLTPHEYQWATAKESTNRKSKIQTVSSPGSLMDDSRKSMCVGLTDSQIVQLTGLLNALENAETETAKDNAMLIYTSLRTTIADAMATIREYLSTNSVTNFEHEYIKQLTLLSSITEAVAKKSQPQKKKHPRNLLEDLI